MDLRWAAHKRGLPLSLRERVPVGRVRERRWANVRLAISASNSIDNLNVFDGRNGVSLIRPTGTFSRGEKGIFVDYLRKYLRRRMGKKLPKTAPQVCLFALWAPAMKKEVRGNAQ
jgi:hypothetical protein